MGFLENKKYIDLDKMYPFDYLINRYKGKGEPFNLNGQDYFVKFVKDEKRCYKELLSSFLLYILNIPHVEYHLAKLFDKPCLISESFYKEDLDIIKGEELLSIYNSKNKYDIDYMNNLDMIEKAFLNNYNLKEEDLIFKNFKDQLYTLFCFDILFQNTDRKSDNWSIFKHAYMKYDGTYIIDEINLGLIYDNERILEDEDDNYSMGFYYEDMITLTNSFSKIKTYIADNVLLREKMLYIINKIDEIQLLNCISKVESKIGSKIPDNIKQEFLKSYTKRLDEIKNYIKLEKSK